MERSVGASTLDSVDYLINFSLSIQASVPSLSLLAWCADVLGRR